MGDPRIQERDNPLVRRLNAVAQENERLGTALGGGVRPPRPIGPVEGGRASVLPPPAVPLTAEEALEPLPPAEQAELEARWAADPSNPANQQRQSFAQGNVEMAQTDLRPTYTPRALEAVQPDRQAAREFMPPDYLGMIERLPITDEQKQTIKTWVFEGAAKEIMLSTARMLDALQERYGLVPKKEEAEGAVQGPGTAKENVPGTVEEVGTAQPGSTKEQPAPVRAKSRRARKVSKVQGSTGV